MDKRYLACSLLRMDNQTPPRDDDPSGMTDFEKNTASEEREQLEQEPEARDSHRIRSRRVHADYPSGGVDSD